MNANRRTFVTKIGLGGVALGAAGMIAPHLMGQAAAPSDVDILNFALNLEYLEAEFYTFATTGKGIDQLGFTITGAGNTGATSGGSQVTLSDATVQAIAMELAFDERQHVALLQGAITSLGGTPVGKPPINLNALGFGFASQNDFLRLARIFEDVGVTAYGGAAPLITNKTILGYAARILAVEAEHVGNVRAQVARLGVSTAPPLDGADILPPPSGSQYFSVNSMALTEVRTPGQVLALAYGAPNVTSGGFFPGGVNGALNISAATTAVNDGASLTASPNPINVAKGQTLGATTLTFNAGGAQFIQIRLGSPTGPELTYMGTQTGSVTTGPYVGDNTTFYLQDVSNGKSLTPANTIATTTVRVVPSTT